VFAESLTYNQANTFLPDSQFREGSSLPFAWRVSYFSFYYFAYPRGVGRWPALGRFEQT